MRSIRFTLTIASALAVLLPAAGSAQADGLAARVAHLETQLETLTAALEEAQEILQYVRVETEAINGLAGPHWIIEGANVHVRSGSGSTHPCPDAPVCAESSGLGNLVVGYNEGFPSAARLRGGTHNLVVGPEHAYRSSGGFVAGRHNSVEGQGASVTGGVENQALGENASICGGERNIAAGTSASVGGGNFNWARGDLSSVSGGAFNTASGDRSSISGGSRNEASGTYSSVSGGEGNSARGEISSVSGGRANHASGFVSSVSGGRGRTAHQNFTWAAGSLFEEN